MRVSISFFSTALLLLSLVSPATAQTGTGAAQKDASTAQRDTTISPAEALPPASSPPLQGGVQMQHMEKAEPVASFLRGGVRLDEKASAKLEEMEPNNYWFKFPAWMAGTWQYEERHIDFQNNLSTRPAIPFKALSQFEFTARWGYQQDKTGAFWQFENTPNANHVVRDRTILYYIMQMNEPVDSSDSSLTCRQFFTGTIVNKETRTILGTGQSEQLTTFTRVGKDQIRRACSDKTFDQSGMPLTLSSWWTIGTRVAPYQRIDTLEGRDLKALFYKYLKAHGLQYLVPDKH